LRTIAFGLALMSNGTGKAVTDTSGQVGKFESRTGDSKAWRVK